MGKKKVSRNKNAVVVNVWSAYVKGSAVRPWPPGRNDIVTPGYLFPNWLDLYAVEKCEILLCSFHSRTQIFRHDFQPTIENGISWTNCLLFATSWRWGPSGSLTIWHRNVCLFVCLFVYLWTLFVQELIIYVRLFLYSDSFFWHNTGPVELIVGL